MVEPQHRPSIVNSPPHAAVIAGDPWALTRALTESSVRSIAVDAWGHEFEPIDLIWSVSHEDIPSVIRCIEILVDAGATTNTTARAIREVLYHTSPATVIDAFLTMTDCDPNESLTTGTVFTPLMSAVSHHTDPVGVCRALLRAGADPNMVSSQYKVAHFITPTLPLHEAIARGSRDAVEVLLESGADPFGADRDTHMRAVHWARHAAASPSVPSLRKDLEALFEALEAGRALHALLWPGLKRELMEVMWHPARLAGRGYFDSLE